MTDQLAGAFPRYRIVTDPIAEARPVDWLEPDRLGRGLSTCFQGDGGVGKGLLLAWIAARITRGEAIVPGGQVNPPACVVLMSTEDLRRQVLVPRLLAAGADFGYLLFPEPLPLGPNNTLRRWMFPDDVDQLASVLTTARPAVLILDPLMALMSPKLSINNDQQVEEAFGPVLRLCEETETAVAYVQHFNKARGNSSIYRGSGSQRIVSMSRIVFAIGPEKEDPERIVLAAGKTNFGRCPSLAYRIRTAPFRAFGLDDPRDNNRTGWIAWDGTSFDTLDDVVSGRAGGAATGEDPEVGWLRDALAGGGRRWSELVEEGKDAGIRPAAIEKARSSLRCWQHRNGFGPGSFVTWHLPHSLNGHTSEPIPEG